jgi:RND family efflux transporter MFP subunit
VDGRIEAVNQAAVSAQTAGEVLAVIKDVGEPVAANGVVLRLRAVQQRSNLQQADAALRAASARASELESRYRRIADMHARNVVAKATLDDITALRDSAVANRDAAQAARAAAREGLSYTEVHMPFAGVVTDRFVRVGEMVAPGTALFSAAALQRFRAIADVSQELAQAIQSKSTATVYLGNSQLTTDKITVYPRAADDTGAFRVRIDLSADGAGLIPGMLVKVGFAIGEESKLLAPASAFVEQGEVTGAYVFEPSGAGRTVLRQVRLGPRRGELIEVLAGLREGDLLAADPRLALRHARVND